MVIQNSSEQFKENSVYSNSIKKEIRNDQLFHNFPIEFSLSLSTEKEDELQQIRSGKIYIDTLQVNQTKNLRFSLHNLEDSKYSFAGLYFNSTG